MIELRTLGGLELRGPDVRNARSLLTHQKPVALLVYLAISARRAFAQHEALLALLWPGADRNHAGGSLRSAVRTVRRLLGEDTILTKGDEELAVNSRAVRCDAVDFEAAIDEGRLDNARDLYRGDLLPAFSVNGAPAFQDWLTHERARLRLKAADAARLLAEQAEGRRQFTLAIDCLRWEVELRAPDERALRRLLEILEGVGDHEGALRAFDAFAKRLEQEHQATPSLEIQALADRIRSRGEVESPATLGQRVSSAAVFQGRAGGAVEVDTVTPLTEAAMRVFSPLPVSGPSGSSTTGPQVGPLDGPRIPGYTIERELGRGGAAIVYLARELKHGRMVALKVLRRELAGSVVADRFLLEINIAARLSHPHILQLYDSGRAGDLLYYVAPYVAGESLRKRIGRERQLGVPEAIRIVREVAEALHYAHRAGVVHRDIKPENVLLADGHAIVADFGIARALRVAGGPSLTESGIAVGTPHYVSPEQAAGDEEVDGRADMYSLGCVLYELLTGSPPYTGVTRQQILALHATAPVPSVRLRRPTVSEPLEQVIIKALAKAPADRFTSAAAFSAALGEADSLERLPVSKQPVSPEQTLLPERPALWREVIGGVVAGVQSHRIAAAGAILALTAGTLWAVLADNGSHGAGFNLSRYAVLPVAAGAEATSAEGAARLLAKALREWRGITVVDPVAVGDGTGPSDGTASGGRTGRAIAAQLKAGRYVRLSVSRGADSLSIAAALFDTRADSLIATETIRVGSDLARADSAMAALADRLLFPPAPSRARTDATRGTRSVAARHAYIRGHAAIEQWDLARADAEFFAAAKDDPQYAEALVWLAQVRSWVGEPPARWRFAAEQAAAGRERLGARDQLLSRALLALSRGEPDRACPIWARLSELEPSDFAAWYGLGNCLRNDDVVVRDPRSPSGWRFRTSYHATLKAYRQAFQLLPSIHRSFRGGSFENVRGLLKTATNSVRDGRAAPPDTVRFAAYPVWQGDSLAFIPVPVQEFAALKALSSDAVHTAIRHQRELFHEIATMWRAALPQSASALEAVALSLDLLGNASAFDTLHLARRLATDPDDRVRMAASEIWMRVKFSVPSDSEGLRAARKLADSVLQGHRPTDWREASLLASLAALRGGAKLAAAYSRVAAARAVAPARPVPAAIAQTAPTLLAYSAMGGPVDSLRALEPRVIGAINSSLVGRDRQLAQSDWLIRPALLAVPEYRFESIPLIAQTGSLRGKLLEAWRTRDLVRAQHLLASLREARRRASVRAPEITTDGLYPEAAVLSSLGDYRGAIEWLEPTLDSLALADPQILADVSGAGSLVRAMALRADLAHRLGDHKTARAWAGAVATLWSDADDFLKPTVLRMRNLAR